MDVIQAIAASAVDGETPKKDRDCRARVIKP
jgi:hypothetical protein